MWSKKIHIPEVVMALLGNVPTNLISKLSLVVYSDPVDAAFKAMGLG
jgi:ATP-dependent Lon protease